MEDTSIPKHQVDPVQNSDNSIIDAHYFAQYPSNSDSDDGCGELELLMHLETSTVTADTASTFDDLNEKSSDDHIRERIVSNNGKVGQIASFLTFMGRLSKGPRRRQVLDIFTGHHAVQLGTGLQRFTLKSAVCLHLLRQKQQDP